MPSNFVSYTVTPGKACKVMLPPCSALEIKNAALVGAEPLTGRCTLECDLATHSFVLCSLPPGGKRQAVLGTVLTNDPDQSAWLFFKARGPCAFHVLGRLQVDSASAVEGEEGASDDSADGEGGYSGGPAGAKESDDGSGEGAEDDWGLGPPKASGGAESRRASRGGGASSPDEPELIDVLLPDGDEADPEFPTDADSDASDDFVQWMQMRTRPDGKRAADAPRKRAAGGARPAQALAGGVRKGGKAKPGKGKGKKALF